jgi:hypothetical protein
MSCFGVREGDDGGSGGGNGGGGSGYVWLP